MLALTIWQPYASLIVGSPPTEGCPGAPPQKPVENRNWRAPARAIGQRVAVHAGKKLDADSFEAVFLPPGFGPVVSPYRNAKGFPFGAVVGVATLDRVIGPLEGSVFYDERIDGVPAATIASWGLDPDGLRWFVGRFGWVFRDRMHLAEPVPCAGAQGLWTLPNDIERAVLAQIGSDP